MQWKTANLSRNDRSAQAALSIKQAASRLAVSTRSIYELCAEGRLRAFKVGRLLRIAPESLEESQRRGAVAACRRVEPLLGRRNRCSAR